MCEILTGVHRNHSSPSKVLLALTLVFPINPVRAWHSPLVAFCTKVYDALMHVKVLTLHRPAGGVVHLAGLLFLL